MQILERVKHLDDLEPGETGLVDCLHFDANYIKRLYGMGIRCDDNITVIRKAVFGGPIHIRVNSTDLFIRRRDAKLVCLK